MKKLLALFLVLTALCATFALAACPAREPGPEEGVTVRIGGLKGPTSMGLVKIMEDDANGASAMNYEFTVAGNDASVLTAALLKGDLDMIAVPANLAATLYNNSNGKIRVLAVNTLGVLHIAAKGVEINSVEDLRGKTVFAMNQGTVTEYTLRYLLSQNGINPDTDVTIEWKNGSEAQTEVIAALKTSENAIAMLPQPALTVAMGQVTGLADALDLNEEWAKLDGAPSLVTGVLVARTAFVEQYPGAVSAFLREYKASADYVNANVDEAASLIEKHGIFAAAVAKKALPDCSIVCLTGAEMKTAMVPYLTMIFEQNAAAVGGKMPDDTFYYGA